MKSRFKLYSDFFFFPGMLCLASVILFGVAKVRLKLWCGDPHPSWLSLSLTCAWLCHDEEGCCLFLWGMLVATTVWEYVCSAHVKARRRLWLSSLITLYLVYPISVSHRNQGPPILASQLVPVILLLPYGCWDDRAATLSLLLWGLWRFKLWSSKCFTHWVISLALGTHVLKPHDKRYQHCRWQHPLSLGTWLE